MENAHAFLANLTLVLCVAAVTTVVFQKLRQPVVLGYLLAGAIVSPNTPFPVFADEHAIHLLSELGVILLMFSLGIEFSFGKLLRVVPTAGVVAVIQSSLMIWLGYVTGQAFGWTVLESIYTGSLIAISSTTIIVKAFEEQKVRGRLAEIVFGVLIVEDLIAIVILAVMTAVSSGTDVSVGSLMETGGRLAAFLALFVGVGLVVVPRLTRAVVRLDRPETIVVSNVAVCFAGALLAQHAGYSVALGAFLAGALVAESGRAERIEGLVQPVRDIFAAIFFVAVGMLIDPVLIGRYWLAVVVLTLVVVVGKVVGVAIGVFLTGQGVRRAIQAGMSLAQIGEFSFIIVGLGQSLGAIGTFLYPVAVAVSAATTLLTPWLIRASDPVATFVDRRLPRPIQTFAALYGTWIEQIRTRPREQNLARRLRRLARLLLVDVAILGGIVIATATWGPAAVRFAGMLPAMTDELAWFLAIGLAAVLAVPFCLGIARHTAALAHELASVALPAGQGGPDMADAPRGALIVMLELGILMMIGIPFFAAMQPFVPAVTGAALFALVLLLLAIALWRRAANLQAHASAGALAIVEFLSSQMRSESAVEHHRDDSLAELHTLLPGLGKPVSIRLREGDHAVGATLAALNLRGLSGATVLAIVRDGEHVTVPTGHEALRAGDTLAVAGTAQAIAAARELIARGSDVTGEG